jgi:predicted nucleic acid-binding protein
VILLDTNVISEMIKTEPDPRVDTWLSGQAATGLFVTTITEAELRYGVALLPPGRRREALMAMVEAVLVEDFADRVLPFDGAAAIAYAEIAAGRRRAGKAIAQFDAQIAAIARSRGCALATRNEADFAGCGIEVINPWVDR